MLRSIQSIDRAKQAECPFQFSSDPIGPKQHDGLLLLDGPCLPPGVHLKILRVSKPNICPIYNLRTNFNRCPVTPASITSVRPCQIIAWCNSPPRLAMNAVGTYSLSFISLQQEDFYWQLSATGALAAAACTSGSSSTSTRPERDPNHLWGINTRPPPPTIDFNIPRTLPSKSKHRASLFSFQKVDLPPSPSDENEPAEI